MTSFALADLQKVLTAIIHETPVCVRDRLFVSFLISSAHC
jgi:hypothetical protein